MHSCLHSQLTSLLLAVAVAAFPVKLNAAVCGAAAAVAVKLNAGFEMPIALFDADGVAPKLNTPDAGCCKREEKRELKHRERESERDLLQLERRQSQS